MRFDLTRSGVLPPRSDPRSHCFDLIAADRSYDAIGPLETWLRHATADAVAWQLLANAYRAEQRMADALRAFERLVALRPDDPKVLLGLATTRYECGLPSAAWFERLVAGGHGTADIILASVAALTAEGQAETADALLQRAITERPDWLAGHEALASLRWRYGDADRLDESFSTAAATHDSVALAVCRARTLALAQAWDRADAVLTQARGRFGDLPPFDAVAAFMASERGDRAQADALFLRSAALDDTATRVAHIRHNIAIGALDRAQALLDIVLATPQAGSAWPYQSLVWRLRDDQRAAWLDGAPTWHHVGAIACPADRLRGLADMLRAANAQRRHPLGQSPRGGTQTEGNLLDRQDAAIPEVRTAIVDAVRAYAAGLPHDAQHPFLGTPRSDIRFAGNWSITLRGGGYHASHTHPRGWLSGVLYLDVPGGDALGDGLNGALALGQPPAGIADTLHAYTHVAPVPGRIVLFPSTMWHATVPFDRSTRLTVAFDVARPRF